MEGRGPVGRPVGGLVGGPVGGLDGGLIGGVVASTSVVGVFAGDFTDRRGSSHSLGSAVPGHITFIFSNIPVTLILCAAKQIIVHAV